MLNQGQVETKQGNYFGKQGKCNDKLFHVSLQAGKLKTALASIPGTGRLSMYMVTSKMETVDVRFKFYLSYK